MSNLEDWNYFILSASILTMFYHFISLSMYCNNDTWTRLWFLMFNKELCQRETPFFSPLIFANADQSNEPFVVTVIKTQKNWGFPFFKLSFARFLNVHFLYIVVYHFNIFVYNFFPRYHRIRKMSTVFRYVIQWSSSL